MNYGFKPTTHGEALIAACMDLGAPLKITRAAVGSGLAGGSLANTHALVHYIADATIADRRHEGNQLFLSIQYRNDAHPELGDFVLSEFIVYALDPETGRETDLLYATLGDSRQPVPSFKSGFPASVWTFPVVLVVSGELQVNITASPGLVTWEDLLEAIDRLTLGIMTNELTLPLAADSGEPLLTNKGTPLQAVYHPDKSAGLLASLEALDGRLSGQIGQTAVDARAYADVAGRTALAGANAYTDGKVLELERRMETDAGNVDVKIAAAKTEAISAASDDAAAKVRAHDASTLSHPAFLFSSGGFISDPAPPLPADSE